MGRNRKNKRDLWMPSRVYRGKSAYEYHPKGGGAIRLAALDAPQSQVLAAYERLTAETESGTVAWLFEQYFASRQFADKATKTRKGYESQSRSIVRVFGHMHPNAVRPVDVRRWMDLRGEKSTYSANRELALFRLVFNWGIERGHAITNPAKGVKRFTEHKRTYYIPDADYRAVYDLAPVMLKAAMEIAYCCAMRRKDVIELTRFNLRDDGIYVQQSKTTNRDVKRWNPRLSAAVKMALEYEAEKAGEYVIRTRSGGKYTEDGFSSVWSDLMEQAASQGVTRFHFHDIKAKAASDYEGANLKHFTNHATEAQAEGYRRKPRLAPTLGGSVPNIAKREKPSD